jgi:RsiW-degrading membrane proteinase PrsW (M82 family)
MPYAWISLYCTAPGLVFCVMFLPELVPGAIVASAIAPALLLLWLVVAADSRPEPPRVVWTAVILGALSAIPTGLLELQLQRVPITHNPWLAVDVSMLLFVGIPEETVKISIIAAIALRTRDFDEPMDGVVYGTAVGLGFAAVENLLYLVGAGTNWGLTAIMRGILSVPFHGALGAIAGAYIARARFGRALGAHSRWRRPRLFLSAWLIPVVLHSSFDASLFSIPNVADTKTTEGVIEVLLLVLMVLIVGFGTIVFAVLLARRIARRQKAWLQTKRLPPAHWRGVWAQCLIGVGLSFVALTLGIAGNSGVNIAGWVLLVIAVGISWKCGRYLKEAAKYRHRSAAVPSP